MFVLQLQWLPPTFGCTHSTDCICKATQSNRLTGAVCKSPAQTAHLAHGNMAVSTRSSCSLADWGCVQVSCTDSAPGPWQHGCQHQELLKLGGLGLCASLLYRQCTWPIATWLSAPPSEPQANSGCVQVSCTDSAPGPWQHGCQHHRLSHKQTGAVCKSPAQTVHLAHGNKTGAVCKSPAQTVHLAHGNMAVSTIV
jgi:hypothetical protein